MDLLSYSFLIGLVGLFLFLIGIGLGKLFNTTNKIRRLGLDRPLNLDFHQQMILYFHFPGISIPVTFAFVGVIMIIVAIICATIGIVDKM